MHPRGQGLLFSWSRQRSLLTIALVLLTLLGVILVCNCCVLFAGSPFCSSDIEQFGPAEVVVLLGSDDPAAIRRRADAAQQLLNKGVASKLVVSGNPQNRGKNEVDLILEYILTSRTLPTPIIRDETGSNTRRSIAFLRKYYADKQVIFVTDDYHGARTMFLARQAGLDAKCFISRSGWRTPVLVKVHLREYLSRTKAVLQTYFFTDEFDE